MNIIKDIEKTIEDLETIEDLILSEVFNTGDDERMDAFRKSLNRSRGIIKTIKNAIVGV